MPKTRREKRREVAVTSDTPVSRFVQELSENEGVAYYTTAEAAWLLGMSTQWIRKMQRLRRTSAPSKLVHYGDLPVYLYSENDLGSLQHYLDQRQKVLVNKGSEQAPTWEEVISNRDNTEETAHQGSTTGRGRKRAAK